MSETKTITQRINRIALFTDIHFGAKSNSELHNQDCLDFVEWFCLHVKSDPYIDAVAFLGDWNENRSSLNIATLNYSYRGAKRLNDLGIPVFFVVGNHDLYHRHTREIHSIVPFNEFDNFIVIEEPVIVNNPRNEDVLFCPYLFHDEYPTLAEHLNIPIWMGHFEFKGFEVTGYGMKMPTGPDPKDYAGPRYIMSGHFHKRQAYEDCNVVYIGNAFPSNFGDAGDFNRGMAVYDFADNRLTFKNWEQCPKYIKTSLTDILDGSVTMHSGARVKCLVDVPISFEESTVLKQSLTEKYNLREFTMEESLEIREVLYDTETSVDWSDTTKLASVDELVEQMLNEINSDHFQNDLLVKIYQGLKSP
jgi:DNA repair exonuclease SbcCD nuclease subunit